MYKPAIQCSNDVISFVFILYFISISINFSDDVKTLYICIYMHFYQIFAISKIILLIIIKKILPFFFSPDVYPSISQPKMTSITEQRGESNAGKQKLHKQIYSYVIHIYTIDNKLLFLIRFQLSHYVFEFSPLEITSFS